MMGKPTFDDQIKAGKAKLEEDTKAGDQLKPYSVHPYFKIMSGTKEVTGEVDDASFEQDI